MPERIPLSVVKKIRREREAAREEVKALRVRYPEGPRQNCKQISDLAIEFSLSDIQIKFAHEYVISFNATRAAEAAGYQGPSAKVSAYTLSNNPRVKDYINYLLAEKRKELNIEFNDVARYWWDLAHADARELCPVRLACCRYCWGIEFGYQFTFNEMREAQRNHFASQLRMEQNKKTLFDEQGGDGYDILKPPNPDCPECRGQGISVPQPFDPSKLSHSAQLLFDGIKVHQNGAVEVKIRDRSRALENLQTLLGFVRPPKPVNVFNVLQMSDDQLDAALKEVEKAIDVTPDRIDIKPGRID